MSKPKQPLTVRECTNLIMIAVLRILPLAAPETQEDIIEDVTAELEALPIVKPTEAKRHKAS